MMSSLETLPHKVYFVCRLSQENWQRLTEALEEAKALNADDTVDYVYETLRLWSPNYASGIGTDILNWPIQTYVQLMKRGLNVELVPRYIPGKICVLAYEHLSPKTLGYKSFVIACQYDRGRPEICNHRVVQNQLNVIDPSTDHFVPHWPQPNLVPRNADRGDHLKVLTYKGRFVHLANAFQQPEFIQALSERHISLDADVTNQIPLQQAWNSWHDYAQTDAVLAVRESNPFLFAYKPASKLVNAWMAGCPALLGPEPAYQQMRKSELDYFEVKSPDDAIAALQHLQENPGYFRAMIENGWQRAQEYDANGVAKHWRDILAGPIAEGYERWQQQSLAAKVMGRPLGFLHKVRIHRQQKKIFLEKKLNS